MVSTTYLHHPSIDSKAKRLVDILGSFVGLIILSGLLIPIAIAIKLESKGPIFYCQERYGLYGQPFTIYKFRSMIDNADAFKSQVTNEAKGSIFKNDRDPRITLVGRILRQTSLDEFPQFWNVLKGEMSLVGTRPPTADEVRYYSPYHWQRLNVKPGLTGEWQVNGRSTVKDFETIVEMDLRYQQQWHPWYDLKIICQTVYVVLRQVGSC